MYYLFPTTEIFAAEAPDLHLLDQTTVESSDDKYGSLLNSIDPSCGSGVSAGFASSASVTMREN